MVSRLFNALAVTFLTSNCTVLLCRGVYVAAMGEGKCLCLREMWSILFRFFFSQSSTMFLAGPFTLPFNTSSRNI